MFKIDVLLHLIEQNTSLGILNCVIEKEEDNFLLLLSSSGL